MSAVLAPDIDEVITDPATYADEAAYHRVFATLRRRDPVHWCEPQAYRPFWAVTRYADVVAIERNAANFLNAPRQFLVTKADEELLQTQTPDGMFARNLVAMDDPDHRVFRALTANWFHQQQVRSIESQIVELARETVDRMIASGEHCDFAADIAAGFPLRTIMIVLGVPPEDEPLMLRLSQKIFGSTDADTGGGAGMTSMLEAYDDFKAYFAGIVADRRANPRDDIATILANADIDGQPIGEAELYAYFLIIAAAGHDTTSSAISGGLLALIENPDQMAKLREQPALMPKAVDEFLRWTTPVKHFFRTAIADCEVGGRAVKAGDSLMMCYPSANRDEAQFEDPFAFRVDRAPNRQIAFGFGPHVCLGQFLARLEMRILFDELLPRVHEIELAGDAAWVKANFVSGLKRLPIRFRA